MYTLFICSCNVWGPLIPRPTFHLLLILFSLNILILLAGVSPLCHPVIATTLIGCFRFFLSAHFAREHWLPAPPSADLTSPKLPDAQPRSVPAVQVPLKSFTLGACNSVILDILKASSEQTTIFHLWYASERVNPNWSSTCGFPEHYCSSLSLSSHMAPFQLWRIRTAPTSPTACLQAELRGQMQTTAMQTAAASLQALHQPFLGS